MSVGGIYDVVTKTPMGDQAGTFNVVPADDGKSFAGSFVGPLGAIDVEDGTIDGDKLRWKVNLTVPMPMTMEGSATVSGDEIAGEMTAGNFGTFVMTGTRKG